MRGAGIAAPGIALAIALAIVFPGRAQQQKATGPVAGLIEHIDCAARLMKKGSTAPVALQPESDDLRPLYAGEQVQCASGKSMTIYTPRTKEKILTPRDAWYEIPTPPEPATTGQTDAAAEDDQKVLTGYSGIAGARPRSILGVIYSPADGSSVKPRDFVVKWNPFQEMRLVNLSIRDGKGAVLWQQDNVPASSKILAPEQARAALMKYRSGGKAGGLTLQLVSQDLPFEIRFSLLSAGDEAALDGELAQWNGRAGGDALLHLRRAYTFGRFRMFSEEAEEYDAALRSSPKSTSLIEAALSANLRNGNRVRADELTKMLPTGAR